VGRACGGLLRVDGGPRHLLPHRPLLPQEGDKEVQQAARQNRQQGLVEKMDAVPIVGGGSRKG
jgi:hypothetical protein